LTGDEIRALMTESQGLIDTIEPRSIANIRDRAIIGLIGYAQAWLDSIITMNAGDYYTLGDDRRWVRFVENGIERRELVDPKLQTYLDEYLAVAQIENEPHSRLFRTTEENGQRISSRPVSLYRVRNRIQKHVSNPDVILSPESGQHLLSAIQPKGIINLRDRAIIGLMIHASASPHTIAGMRASDYYSKDGQQLVRLSLHISRLAGPPLVALMDDYVAAVRSRRRADSPMFGVRRRPQTYQLFEDP
jgi:hypothetical protein